MNQRRTRLFKMLVPLLITAGAGSARNFYVDSATGGDSLSGTSPTTAWRTLSPVKKAKLAASDTVRLKRGCSWSNQSLELYFGGNAGAPVVLTSYGSLSLPMPSIHDTTIRVIGLAANHIVVESLSVSGARQACVSTMGTGRKGLTIRRLDISGCSNGIMLANTDTAEIVENQIHDIRYTRSTAGAVGIVVDESKNVKVVGNRLVDCSDTLAGRSDGGAIELFRSNENIEIGNNRARRTWGFLEMGGLSTDTIRNVIVHHNIAMETRTLAWINLDTPQDTTNVWGVAYSGVAIVNNTFIQNNSLVGFPIGSNTTLTDSNQIVIANNLVTGDSVNGFVYLGGFRRANNLFYSGYTNLTAKKFKFATGEIETPPLFLDVDTSNIRYNLSAASPAVDAGIAYPSIQPYLVGTQAATMLESVRKATSTVKIPDIGATEYGLTADTPKFSAPFPRPRFLGRNLTFEESGANASKTGSLTLLRLDGTIVSRHSFAIRTGTNTVALPNERTAGVQIAVLRIGDQSVKLTDLEP